MAYTLDQNQLAQAAKIQDCIRLRNEDDLGISLKFDDQDGAKVLVLTATSHDTHVLVRTQIPVKKAGTKDENIAFAIRGTRFARSASMLPAGDAQLALKDTSLTAKAGNTKYTFRVDIAKEDEGAGGLVPETKDLVPETKDAVTWSLKAKDLIDLIQSTSYALSRQTAARAQLTSVNLKTDAEQKKVIGYATDGYRLAVTHVVAEPSSTKKDGEIDILIPQHSAVSLVEACRLRAPEDQVEICCVEGGEKFVLKHQASQTAVVLALFASQPFDSQRVLNEYTESVIDISVQRNDLVSALQRVDAINPTSTADAGETRIVFEQSGDGKGLMIEFSKDNNTLGDQISAEIQARDGADKLDSRFALQPRFLQDAIRATSGKTIKFERFARSREEVDKGICIFDPDSADKHLDLVMPVRLPPRSSTKE